MQNLGSMPFKARLAAAAALALLAGCASPPVATSGGDPVRGAAVVTQWCGTCHAIEGVEADRTRAPTYAQIAQRPGRDRPYLARFLEEDHFPMTTYRLLDSEKADVIALIVSLKK